jgi:hypothetical protein
MRRAVRESEHLMQPTLHCTKSGTYVVHIGQTHVAGKIKSQPFSLGHDRLIAEKRAGRILRLWQSLGANVWASLGVRVPGRGRRLRRVL